MFHAIISVPRLAALALAFCVACSSVGTDEPALPAASAGMRLDPAVRVAVRVDPPTPQAPLTAPAAAAIGHGHSARTSPVQVLEQLVTAQALLVTLLLTPLAKDGSEEPVARVDMSRNATSGPLP